MDKRGKVGFHVSAYSTKRVEKSEGKSDVRGRPAQPPIKCPECNSSNKWKDGIRYTNTGQIQRFICRDCGYRFSESIHMNKNSEPYSLDCRVCVTETEGTKNLAKVENRTENRLAGATKPTESRTVTFIWELKKQGFKDTQ